MVALQTTWTPVVDDHEPNDSPDEATDISLVDGTTNAFDPSATAYLFAGRDNSEPLVRADYDDWYSVTLTAGTVRVRISDVPEDVRLDAIIEDSTGAQIEHGYQADRGADLSLEAVATAGEHFVRVTMWLVEDSKGRGSDLPSHFTETYELRVTQTAE